MDDEQLVGAFERAELSGDAFSHTEHVRVGWWYLKHHPFAEARRRLSEALRRFAAAKGKAERYHETLTVAYLLIIAERLQQTPGLTWPEFAARHADVLARRPAILERYYSDATLSAERARTELVLPDRQPLPVLAAAVLRAEGDAFRNAPGGPPTPPLDTLNEPCHYSRSSRAPK